LRVEVMAARIDATLKHDRLDHLPRITAPTMVVGADDDTLVPPYFGAAIAAPIPGARLVRMREGGHNCFRMDPADFNRILEQFWQVWRSPHPDAGLAASASGR
jgi:pimeloyl-ACP methyl ester carboxylesterase